jgi:phosphoglycolate phosphatase
MIHAFADAIGVPPAAVAMVGDTLHDLDAARGAGAVAIAVVRDGAEAGILAEHADVVIADLGALVGVLSLEASAAK